MKYIYRFDCLITDSQVMDIKKVMAGKLEMDLKYNFIFDIKDEDDSSETTISVEFYYSYGKILKITIKRVNDDEIIYNSISTIDDIYKILSVYIVDFKIGKVSYNLLLNLDSKEPKGINGDIERNISRLENFRGKTKGNHFTELFNEICYLNFNSILEIIHVAYALCCMENNEPNVQGLFLKKKFAAKLNEVGIDFREILKDISLNTNEFKNKLDNLETLNLSDLCFTLLGVVFISDEYKNINSKKNAISKDRYFDVIEKLIKTNKGIELL